MVNTITLKELRPELPHVIDQIDEKFDRYVVTRRGKPVCVMMSVDDYESMLETVDILQDDELMKRIRAARKDVVSGHTIPLDDLKKKIERV